MATAAPTTPGTPGSDADGGEAGPGDRLVRIGAAIFGVGAVATLATVLPLFLGVHKLPLAAYLLSMLMPLGFGVALAGLVRAARSQRA